MGGGLVEASTGFDGRHHASVFVIEDAASAYLTVVLVLRAMGKRTLSKLNAFDLVVTVALGSTLATILLNSEVSWSEGALALMLLAGAQFLVAWVTVRVPGGRAVVTAPPALLLRGGRPREHVMRQQRVTLAEVRQASEAAAVAAFHRSPPSYSKVTAP